MSIPPAGTFEYAGVVPEDKNRFPGQWRLIDQSGAGSFASGDSLIDDRLVGLQPLIDITDAGLTPDVRLSPFTGSGRPKVLLSRLTLRADSKDRATIAAFSFCVDRALISSFRPGDVLHVTRTACGGLGLSVIREGRLLAAVGAVTAVPLGESVRVRIPADVIQEAERAFSRLDSTFEFPEFPLEVHVASERRVLFRGRPRIGGYEVFVEHGYYPGTPGTDECAALSLVGGCPGTAAICSAQLLEYSDLCKMVRW